MFMEDFRYALERTAGTIVMANGEPSKVVDGNILNNVFIVKLLKEYDNLVQVDYNSIDFTPVTLGYVNYRDRASYLSRKPMRRDWRQGLRDRNCSSTGIPFRSIGPVSLRKCILGKYPRMSSCIKLINRYNKSSWAWHRHWAINNRGNLLYKYGRVVGQIEKGRPVLNEENYFLQEYLEECLYEQS